MVDFNSQTSNWSVLAGFLPPSTVTLPCFKMSFPFPTKTHEADGLRFWGRKNHGAGSLTTIVLVPSIPALLQKKTKICNPHSSTIRFLKFFSHMKPETWTLRESGLNLEIIIQKGSQFFFQRKGFKPVSYMDGVLFCWESWGPQAPSTQPKLEPQEF